MNPKTLSGLQKILVVDDDADSLRIIEAALKSEGYEVFSADCGERALEAIENDRPHLVLLDVNMPGLDGLETLRRLRSRDEYVSCLFVSAKNDTTDIIRGLDRGADDYIVKPFEPLELLARVRSQLRIKELNDRLSEANRKLLKMVDLDHLTGLFNMRSLYKKLDFEIDRAERFNRSLGVMMMDIDNFKRANDEHDHLFGSHVISSVGALIRDNIRKVDFGARYGGDEFLVVLTEIDLEGAVIFADRVRKNIEAKIFENDQHSMRFTVSVGLSVCHPAEKMIDARSLVRFADRALYKAKELGRNRVEVYEPSKQELPPKNPAWTKRQTKRRPAEK